MKPPKCRLCEALHWSHEPHKFATNTIEVATNTATNRDDAATNKGTAVHDSISAPAVQVGVGESESVVARTSNRRSREAYNSYQREYMRKRRANLVP